MELKDIQTLIKLVSNTSVDQVLIEKKEFKLNIKKNATSIVQAPTVAAPQPVASAPAPAAPAAPAGA